MELTGKQRADYEQAFKDYKWNCDICPLSPCRDAGFMLTEDCFDDVVEYCRKHDLYLPYLFTECIKARENKEEDNK